MLMSFNINSDKIHTEGVKTRRNKFNIYKEPILTPRSLKYIFIYEKNSYIDVHLTLEKLFWDTRSGIQFDTNMTE